MTQVGGRLGIGTSNPTSTLTVAGTTFATSFDATNDFVADAVGIHTQTSGLFDNTPLKQGAYMSWNHGGSEGKTDFVCKRGTGIGGFNFMTSNGSGTNLLDGKLLLATLDSTSITCGGRFSPEPLSVAHSPLGWTQV